MTLLELAEACERADGADRELDAAISAIIEPYEDSFYHRYESPRYTASLDAAMSLVPEGWDWEIGHTNGGMTIYANVGGAHEYVDHFEWRRFASSAPLALASAALRARHAMAMEEKDG